MIRYEVYLKHLHQADLDGQLRPFIAWSFQSISGPNGLVMMPGGKGHEKHKALRTKLLRCIGPKPVLKLQPEVLQLVRGMLEEMVRQTESEGFATFEPLAGRLAMHVAMLPIVNISKLEEEELDRMVSLVNTAMNGLVCVPLNWGRWTTFGRAMLARKDLEQILASLTANPDPERQCIPGELLRDTGSGRALTTQELLDTLISTVIAGKVTTQETFPEVLVKLQEHRQWISRLADEPLAFESVEDDSATLRFVKEVIRWKSPAPAIQRVSHEDVDCGEHGLIPKGCPILVELSNTLRDLGSDFDPDRWATEDPRKFVAFGGPTPKVCPGRYLSLLELQVFARLLCREYDFEVLDTTEAKTVFNPIGLGYKDGCKVRVSRKSSEQHVHSDSFFVRSLKQPW